MKIYADIDTLAEVWNLFEEIGAEGLLIGKKLTGDLSEIVGFFVGKKKLAELCQIITHSDEDFGKKDLTEVAETINDFFVQTGAGSAKLFSTLAVRPATEKPKKPIQPTTSSGK